MASNYEVEIKKHPFSDAHVVVKIIRNQRVRACVYARPFPTEEEARQDFERNPRDFQPYNESTGTFVR